MGIPKGLQPLLDADIIRYELGFAAEAGWKAISNTEDLPPWGFVEDLLQERIAVIKNNCFTDKDPILYLTSGRTFRFDVAKKKPYKGTRKENKPFHFDNLTAYLTGVLNAKVITGIEADDAMAIDQCSSGDTTIICSRDKDLRQVPGYTYSWELGRQPSFGPDYITKKGTLELSSDRKKLKGTGMAWFYAQILIGDTVDNITGLPNCGPVRAYDLLKDKSLEEMLSTVTNAYAEVYGDTWETEMLEQGQLVWLIRKLNEDGSPVMYQIGMEE